MHKKIILISLMLSSNLFSMSWQQLTQETLQSVKCGLVAATLTHALSTSCMPNHENFYLLGKSVYYTTIASAGTGSFISLFEDEHEPHKRIQFATLMGYMTGLVVGAGITYMGIPTTINTPLEEIEENCNYTCFYDCTSPEGNCKLQCNLIE